ncbi:MAG: hypothetical protein U0U67_08925 [Chitinophagales bacterium]
MAKYIPNDLLEKFLKSYENDDIWQVHQLNSIWLIVFLYYDKQIDENKNLPIYQQMKNEYFELVKKYLDDAPENANQINIQFDSKEKFDSKYNGDWYDYYH